MRIIDVSMEIHHGMMVYKNMEVNRPTIENLRNFESSSMYESGIRFNMHTGTHVDFPLHAIKDGGVSTGHDISRFISKAKVLDLRHVEDCIKRDDLSNHAISKGDFILLKTKNSEDETFNPNFVYLCEDAARYLSEQNINGVGIDALGIERNQPDHRTHKHLLQAGIIILEGLRLKEIEQKEYTLLCLPLKIKGVEALPVRAVLLEE